MSLVFYFSSYRRERKVYLKASIFVLTLLGTIPLTTSETQAQIFGRRGCFSGIRHQRSCLANRGRVIQQQAPCANACGSMPVMSAPEPMIREQFEESYTVQVPYQETVIENGQPKSVTKYRSEQRSRIVTRETPASELIQRLKDDIAKLEGLKDDIDRLEDVNAGQNARMESQSDRLKQQKGQLDKNDELDKNQNLEIEAIKNKTNEE